MIVSLNWLKKYVDIDVSVDELAHLIGTRLVEIEEVISLKDKYDGILVAKVVACEKLEGSDHLSLCLLDDNGVSNAQRDENGLVQVICGAPNVRKGLTVAWLPPGVIVPETYGKENFKLLAKPLMGKVSNGMIASIKELDLGDDHSGIVELPNNLAAGTSFKEVYELNDYLLDIENKSLTHRPDCFGLVGFAREVSAILDKPFKTPDFLNINNGDNQLDNSSADLSESNISIKVLDEELSKRYEVVALKEKADFKKDSTFTLIGSYLARVGMRPISPLVDVTNYVMLLTGQPLHAFDLDKLRNLYGDEIKMTVRKGESNETLKLLDGKEVKVEDDIVICANNHPVALAGAMGGSETEIDDNTKNVLVEVATFDLYSLRATQMRHGIFSEAITRFTKGQPGELTEPVLNFALGEFLKNGFVRSSKIYDDFKGKKPEIKINLSLAKINAILGQSLTVEDVKQTLSLTEFKVSSKGEDIKVIVPYWRQDIHIPEDIIEEVGRIRGYDKITPNLPTRKFIAEMPEAFDVFRDELRGVLSSVGGNEVYTYSFISESLMEKVGQNKDLAYRITNAISPELQRYRLSLTPSLLEKVHPNIKRNYQEFMLFELNKVHSKDFGLDQKEGIPNEEHRLALVLSANKKTAKNRGSAYYQAKYVLDYLASKLNIEFTYKSLMNSEANLDQSLISAYEPKRSAVVMLGEECLGVIGEYTLRVMEELKLQEYTAGFELDLEKLYRLKKAKKYQKIGRFQGTSQDLSITLNNDVNYQKVKDAVMDSLKDVPLSYEVSPLDIYQKQGSDQKTITLHFEFKDLSKNIDVIFVKDVIKQISDKLKNELSAKID